MVASLLKCHGNYVMVMSVLNNRDAQMSCTPVGALKYTYLRWNVYTIHSAAYSKNTQLYVETWTQNYCSSHMDIQTFFRMCWFYILFWFSHIERLKLLEFCRKTILKVLKVKFEFNYADFVFISYRHVSSSHKPKGWCVYIVHIIIIIFVYGRYNVWDGVDVENLL